MGDQGAHGSEAQTASQLAEQAEHNEALQEQLRKFWIDMAEDVEKVGTDPMEFKTQQLPLARIKKIMKSDEDVRMISAEAPVLFAKACEFFILEMTLRSWHAAEEAKRRTLQRSDAATAISRTEVFDFLVDVVPMEEGAAQMPAGMSGEGAGAPMAGPPAAQQGLPQAGGYAPHPYAQHPGMMPPQAQAAMMFQQGMMPPGAMFMQPLNQAQQAQQQQFIMAVAQAQAQAQHQHMTGQPDPKPDA